MEAAVAAWEEAAKRTAGAASAAKEAAVAVAAAAREAAGAATAANNAAVAALAIAEQAATDLSTAKETAVAAESDATEAAAVATAAKEAAAAALATQKLAAAASASPTAKKTSAAAEAAGVARAAKEAAAAILATEKLAAAASSTAKEAAVAAQAAVTEAAAVAAAAKEAAVAAVATAKQAAATWSTAEEVAVAAETAAKESVAAAAAAAKELAAAVMRYSKKRRFHQIDGGWGGGNRDDRGNLDLISASPTRSSAASSPFCATESAVAAAAAVKGPAVAAAATVKEPAVAMRCSKKPRFHQIDDGGSVGANCDDRGNLDLISALPDDVLGSIISLLPTKDGARTQAISRRWLPLWRSAPLNLMVIFQEGIKNSKLVTSVSKILSEHRGHARRLLLNLLNPTDIPVRCGERKIHGWLQSRALDSLQELDFTYRNMDMPLLVFRFAPTLRVARFSHCILPKSISTLRLKFPCLKQLTLNMVTVTDGLHNILNGCTALESLELRDICGIGDLYISSQTLRSLAFSPHRANGRDILHVVIKEAPALERLLPLYSYRGQATIRVIRAPKLEILGLLSESISKVQFGTTTFEKMIAVSLPTKIHTVKVLVVNSIGPNLDEVLDFLKCFPCLVRLYVILQSEPTKDVARKYNPLESVECLELSLKNVVLMYYYGNKRPYVDFARFFILNTKFLKEMDIRIQNDRNKEWMANHHRQLCVDRASRDAQINISTKNYYRKVDTHDLSMADPFYKRSFV